MKRFILTAAIAAATITASGSLAQAGTPVPPTPVVCQLGSPDGYHQHEYHVMYFDCSCGHWKCYGVYDSKCQAKPAADKLARAGHKVRIEVELV